MDTATHTPQILGNMKYVSTLIPVGMYALAVKAFTVLYKITTEKVAIARKELAEREAAK